MRICFIHVFWNFPTNQCHKVLNQRNMWDKDGGYLRGPVLRNVPLPCDCNVSSGCHRDLRLEASRVSVSGVLQLASESGTLFNNVCVCVCVCVCVWVGGWCNSISNMSLLENVAEKFVLVSRRTCFK